jgi:hypothetical protein
MRRPSGLLMLANRNDLQICEDPALFAEQGVRNRVNHQTTSRGLYFRRTNLEGLLY